VDAVLPAALRTLLRADLATLADAPMPVITLLTVRPDGWPHVAYLGPGELFCADETRLGMATWADSRSTEAAVSTGKVTLQTVLDDTPVLVRLRVTDRGTGTIEGRHLRLLEGHVVESTSDTAPYATLRSGTTFTVGDTAREVVRWERTRATLRQALPD
jgi:hypothetical protein